MAGLQGAGKTTTVAKLARLLKEREKKKVAVVSADVYRPAAIAQLETLAGEFRQPLYRPLQMKSRWISPSERCKKPTSNWLMC